MSKLPSIQFYPGDWRKDPGVQALSYHDRGVWFEILLLMFESSERGKLLLNGRPMPDDALARLLGLDKQILTNTLTKLLEFGVASRDADSTALVCRRMVRDEEIRKIRAKCGKLGGNPDLLNQAPKQKTTTQDNQNPTPSVSSSTSSSDNDTLTLVTGDGRATRRVAPPDGWPPTVEQAKSRAASIGVPADMAETFWNHCEGVGEWPKGKFEAWIKSKQGFKAAEANERRARSPRNGHQVIAPTQPTEELNLKQL